MSKTNPQDQAFGFAIPGNEKAGWLPETVEGLTKREYFAAMAMQGFLSSASSPKESKYNIAKKSVEIADELIERLNR